MTYLIVMPKNLGTIEHFNIFPIGLAYISASLKQAGHPVVTANLDALPGNTDALLRSLIQEHNVKAVCTGGLSRDYLKIKEIVDCTQAIDPHILTIIGGGIISADPEPAMQALGAHIGVIGEGEKTIRELAQALQCGSPLEKVPGLILPGPDGGFRKTAARAEILDIDGIPFPDFEGFQYSEWTKRTGSAVLLTDRSCPFRCTFCFHPTGSKYRQRSMDNIFKEIDYQVAHFGIQSIGLSSELFATRKERVLDFCQRIKPYGLPWSCCLRVCDIEKDLLLQMKESGCVNLVLGLESADNQILKSMRKGITVEQITRALELTLEAGIMIEGGFIFGDVMEDTQSVQNTLNYWEAHTDDHYLNLGLISVFPGSSLYQHAVKEGLIPDPVQFLKEGCPLVNVSRLSPAEYQSLRSKVAELRLRPHVPARELQIQAMDDANQCGITYPCRKCGAINRERVHFWFGRECRCHTCGLVNFIDPFQAARHDPEIFGRELPPEVPVALWGAGGICRKLIQKYPLLGEDRFLLVDGNPELQGLKCFGKEIHPPEIIQRLGIAHVVITALSREREIALQIRQHHGPAVTLYRPSLISSREGITPVLMAQSTPTLSEEKTYALHS